MELLQYPPSACARKIELRREIIAVMRLRGLFDRTGRRTRTAPRNESRPSLDAPQIIVPIRILSICDYDGLRVARELLLNQEGYSTESYASSDSFDALSGQIFHLAILCHSVAQQQAIRIADMLHRYNSRILVLRLGNSDPRCSSSFDCEVDGFTGPGKLLEIIRETILRGARFTLRP